jgi:hypothetical protein
VLETDILSSLTNPAFGSRDRSSRVRLEKIAPEPSGKDALLSLPRMRSLLPVTVMRAQDRHGLGSGRDTVRDLEIGRARKLETRAQHRGAAPVQQTLPHRTDQDQRCAAQLAHVVLSPSTTLASSSRPIYSSGDYFSLFMTSPLAQIMTAKRCG